MAKARQDNLILLHMAALLFSLAEMALHANYLPFAQRLVLFAAMRRGDAAARKIAIRAGSGAAFIIPHNQNGDDEALRLAIGFRMLAVALMNLGLRQQAMLSFADEPDGPSRDDHLHWSCLDGSTNRRQAQFERPLVRAGPPDQSS